METHRRTAPARTVGVYGGSFNPPHVAHVLACQFALCTWPLDKIVVIPAHQHPFAKELEPFERRIEMARLAFAHLEPWVEVSSIEEEMGGVSYTIDTVMEWKRRFPCDRVHLLLGSDVLDETSKWKDFDRLAAEAPPLVIPRLSADRPAETALPGDAGAMRFFLPAVSSSAIREILARGADPGAAVPRTVADYIRMHGLYRAARP